jgi:Kef-type K+ transport system membrane component KefB
MACEPALLLLVGGVLLAGTLSARIARVWIPSATRFLVAGLILGAFLETQIEANRAALELTRSASACVGLFGVGACFELPAVRARARSASVLAMVSLAGAMTIVVGTLSMPALELGLEASGSQIAIAALAVATASPTILLSTSRDDPRAGGFGATMLVSCVLLNAAVVASIVSLGGATEGLSMSCALGVAVGGALGFVLVHHGVGPAAIGAVIGCVLLEPLPASTIAAMTAALSAGLVEANFGARRRERETLSMSLEVGLAAFFGLTGLLVAPRELLPSLAPALAIVVARGIGIFASGQVAGWMLRDEDVRRLGFSALLPQAGFPLLLVGATTVLGARWQPLLASVVLLNGLVMPPLSKIAQLTARDAKP